MNETADSQRAALQKHLEALEREYNPDLHLYGHTSGNPWWMSHIPEGRRVHGMLENLYNTIALLESGEPLHVVRANKVLSRVLSQQDTDLVNPWYGVWGRYYEEPAEKVPMPERLGCDFEGAALAHILVEHGAKLSPDVRRKAYEAMERVGWAIFRRNVGVAYSNIAVMGACVSLAAGEVLNEPRLMAYGRRKLGRLVDHTVHNGGFTEWNSPTYTRVVLNECERIMQLIQDPGARAEAERLRRTAWEEVAHYFHPGTQQWGGPHSRAYADRLTPDAVADLSSKIGLPIRLHPAMGDPHVGGWSFLHKLPCPEDLIPRFRRLPEEEMTVHRLVIKGDPGEDDFVTTTWFTEDACLGSVNLEDLWFQRRTVLGYWRTPDDPAVVLRVRFLHDLYDFSSAYARNAQEDSRVLTAFGLLTDMGDRIAHLDRPADGLFEAGDFRIRYELIGAGVSARQLDAGRYELAAGPRKAIVHAEGGRFGSNEVAWQLGREEGRVFVDGICYQGPRKKFDLVKVGEVAVAGGLEVLGAGDAPANTSPQLVEGRARPDCFTASWAVGDGLVVTGPMNAIAYPGYKGGDKKRANA